MSTLRVLRGLPGSGKTTAAVRWCDEADDGSCARVNRDDIRAMVFNREGVLPYKLEEAITMAQTAAVVAYLQSGINVVVDDTNLRVRYVKRWADVAAGVGASFEVLDIDPGVDECVARDLRRHKRGGRYVGEDVIRAMHNKYLSKGFPVFSSEEYLARQFKQYTPDFNLPSAYIFDIDGTLAHMVSRTPHEYHRVMSDVVDEEVRRMLWQLQDQGHAIILLSGRPDSCRDLTETWLDAEGIAYKALYMRETDDGRDDAIVKDEIFETHIAEAWNVRGVFDDRNRVVRMWRAKGIKTYQVEDGNF